MTDKQKDVAFLADNFDIPAGRAAALVAGSADEASALTTAQIGHENAQDPYGDAPVPTSPEEHEIPENGGLQKTVLKRVNRTGRVGP